MIWDHNIDAAQPTRMISKAAYYGLLFEVTVGVTIVETIIAIALMWWFRIPYFDAVVGGSGVANVFLARFLVDIMLKRRGMSRSGKAVTTWTRAALIPAGNAGDEAVDALLSPSLMQAGVLSGVLGTLLFGGLSLHSWLTRSKVGMTGVDWGLVIIFFLCCSGTLYLLWVACWLKPRTTVDAAGVWGYPRDLAIRRRFFPWSSIAACEVETYHDTFGKPRRVRPILRGWHGERLIRLDLTGTEREDQERLIRAIQARLPKPAKDDGWE